LAVVCFAVGVLLGFVGAGGAGVMVSLLNLGFHLPIHEAVGTSLAAMFFVTLSGAISHYREGNTNVRAGITIGVAGIAGAVAGADIGQAIPEHILKLMAGFALWFLALLVYMRARVAARVVSSEFDPAHAMPTTRQNVSAVALGVSGGVASAFFGVGMTPWLQLGTMTILKLPLIKTIGTTMLALIFISLSGSLALARHGDVSVPHLIGATVGMTIGSYAGAKFTRRAPLWVLRGAIVLTPFTAGTLLIFF
jgi:uncharacterized membrane protein YfcA